MPALNIATLGRTATLTYSGTLSASSSHYATALFGCPFGGASLLTDNGEGFLRIAVGSSYSDTDYASSGFGGGSGTCRFTATVEEIYFEDFFGHPTVRWRFLPGSSLDFEATVGSLSVALASTVNEALLSEVPFLEDLLQLSYFAIAPTGGSASAGAAFTSLAGAIWSAPTLTRSFTHPTRPTASATVTSGPSGSVSVTGSSTGFGEFFPAGGSASGMLDRPVEIDGRIFRGSDLITDSIAVTPLRRAPITATGGSFSASYTEKNYRLQVSAFGLPAVQQNLEERIPSSPIGVSFATAPGPAIGDPALLDSFRFLGSRRPIGTIAKTARVVVFGDDGAGVTGSYTPTWTTPTSGATVTPGTNLVTISGPSSKALLWNMNLGAPATTNNGPAARAFTHVRLKMRKVSSGAEEITMRWGNSGWDIRKDWKVGLTGGGTWDTTDFPLYAETNAPPAWQNRITSFTVWPDWYAGAGGHLSFEGLGSSDYEIGLIELRDDSGMTTRLHWYHDGPGSGFYSPCFGQTGPALTLYELAGSDSAASWANRIETAPTSALHYRPGWTTTITEAGVAFSSLTDTQKIMTPPTFDDAYLSGVGPVGWLFGGGIEYDSGAYLPRFGPGALAPGDLWMQWTRSQINYHARWNGWGGITLRCYARLGTQYVGISLDRDGAARAGDTISVLGPRADGSAGDATGTTSGEGVAIVQGKEGNTGTDAGAVTANNSAPSSPVIPIAGIIVSGFALRRLVWRGGSTGGGKPSAICLSADRTVVALEGTPAAGATVAKMMLRFSWLGNFGGSWEERETPFLGKRPCLGMVGDSRETIRLLYVTEAGEVKSRRTEDEGASWMAEITITSDGVDTAQALGPGGITLVYYRRGASIRMKGIDGNDQTVIAEQIVVATGVSSAGFSATWREGDQVALLVWTTTAGEVKQGKTKNGYTLL